MKERIAYTQFESPWGEWLVASSPRGLCLVQFGTSLQGEPSGQALERAQATLAPLWGAADWVESRSENADVLEALRGYVQGRRRHFALPRDLRGTPFQLAAWQALQRIPCGETRTYAELARAAGRPKAFRAAGMACHTNRVPIVVPCHRVVGSNGALTGFGGGLQLKRALLAHEQRFVSLRGFPRSAGDLRSPASRPGQAGGIAPKSP